MRWPFAVKTGLERELVESASASTRFAFKLYREISWNEGTTNIFFSPASVMLCLCLLHAGATGETRAAIEKVLEVAGHGTDVLPSTVAALKSALLVEGPGLECEIANSIWCNQARTPRPEYAAKVKEDYNAEVIAVDFADPATVAQINRWVSGKTRGKIGSILESLDRLAVLVAINAIYFKDFWEKPFEAALTREELFHASHGRTVKTPLMSQYGSYPYYEDSEFQAVRLRYKTSRLAMYIFLPAKRSSLERFQQNLSSAAWDKWMQKFHMTEGHIRLPRFKLTYSAILNSALEKLGMAIAFDPRRARFDTISTPPPPIWIDQVLHRAFVEVDEEGTEAAAVTAVVQVTASPIRNPARTFQMVVDRPFFFAIRDDHTGTIWFMGAVDEPNASDWT
jgi:serine protease inhibitor